MFGSSPLRRPAVNIKGMRFTSEEEDHSKRYYCPHEGRRMIFRDDLDSLWCPECGFSPTSTTTKTVTTDNNNNNNTESLVTPDGFISKSTAETALEDSEEDQALKFQSIPNPRRQEYIQRKIMGSRVAGFDDDLKMLRRKGYSITKSEEIVSTEGTYNPNEQTTRYTTKTNAGNSSVVVS